MITAKNVLKIREAKGWTQQQLADALLCTTRTVQNWEQRGCKSRFFEKALKAL